MVLYHPDTYVPRLLTTDQCFTKCKSSKVRVSISVIIHQNPKQLEEERVCFRLQLSGHTHQGKPGQELKAGRNLEVGAEEEAMEGRCLLACFSWLAHPAFL